MNALRSLVLVACVAGSARGASLECRSPSGFEFSVDADGLRAVRLGGRTVALGRWTASVRADDGSTAGIAADRTARRLDDGGLEVRHRAGDVSVTYRYRVVGDDLRVEMRVVNDTDDACGPVVFEGLEVDFGREPNGAMRPPTDDASTGTYPTDAGAPVFYALGYGFALGVTWVDGYVSAESDDETAALPPPPRGGRAVWTSVGPGRRGLALELGFDVPPAGADTVTLVLRLVRGDDWPTAIETYVGLYGSAARAAGGGPRGDHRTAIAVSLAPKGARPTEDSPLGLAANRRIDRPGEAAALGARIAGLASEMGARSVFLADLPRRDPASGWVMNWNTLPKEADDGVRELVARLAEDGIATVVEAWPRNMQVPAEWRRTAQSSFDPLERHNFKQAQWGYVHAVRPGGWGVAGLLLRGMGAHPRDMAFAVALRELIDTHKAIGEAGTKVCLVADRASDLTWPLASAFTSVRWSRDDARYVFERGGLAEFAVARTVEPELPIYVELPAGALDRPAGARRSPAEFALSHRLTPVVPLGDLEGDPRRAAAWGALVRRYLDAEGRWNPKTTRQPAPPPAVVRPEPTVRPDATPTAPTADAPARDVAASDGIPMLVVIGVGALIAAGGVAMALRGTRARPRRRNGRANGRRRTPRPGREE